MNRIILLLSSFLMVSVVSFSQDTVILDNGDEVHGEVKNLTESVLTVETPYSDSDFKIEWEHVKQLISPREFNIHLSSKENLYATLNTSGKEGYIILTNNGEYLMEVRLEDIVILDDVEESFENRFAANISGGYTRTKANETRQLTFRAFAAYYARYWSLDLNFNTINTLQSEVDPVERMDGGINFNYLIYNNWFGQIKSEFLSNNEQELDLRFTNTLALGNLIVRTNRLNLSGSAGITYNWEDYTNESEIFTSRELFIGGVFNAYDIGDLSFKTNLGLYPSLTESGRYRVDLSSDLKYDFPLDFFLKIGFTLNFDSQPPNEGEREDYVLTTTIGWDF